MTPSLMKRAIEMEVFPMMDISRCHKEFNGFIYRVLASLQYEGYELYITHEDYGDMMLLFGIPKSDMDEFLAIAETDIHENHDNYETLYEERFMD